MSYRKCELLIRNTVFFDHCKFWIRYFDLELVQQQFPVFQSNIIQNFRKVSSREAINYLKRLPVSVHGHPICSIEVVLEFPYTELQSCSWI